MTRRLPFDPVAEARRQWVEHGWAEAAPGMAANADLTGVHGTVIRPPGPTPGPGHGVYHCPGPPILGVSVQPTAPSLNGGNGRPIHGVVTQPPPPPGVVCPL